MLVFEKITKHRAKYAFFASTKAFIFIMLILFFLELEQMHLVALGSSAFAAFAIPRAHTAHTRNLIGSYIIAIFVGIGCWYLSKAPYIVTITGFKYIIGGLSVSITMALLIALYLEHPPSAGVSLGFIINPWDIWTPFALFIGIIGLIFFRYITHFSLAYVKKRMKKK